MTEWLQIQHETFVKSSIHLQYYLPFVSVHWELTNGLNTKNGHTESFRNWTVFLWVFLRGKIPGLIILSC